MSDQEKLENLKEELNSAVIYTKSLISDEIVELSQELDKLIVSEYRSMLEDIDF